MVTQTFNTKRSRFAAIKSGGAGGGVGTYVGTALTAVASILAATQSRIPRHRSGSRSRTIERPNFSWHPAPPPTPPPQESRPRGRRNQEGERERRKEKKMMAHNGIATTMIILKSTVGDAHTASDGADIQQQSRSGAHSDNKETGGLLAAKVCFGECVCVCVWVCVGVCWCVCACVCAVRRDETATPISQCDKTCGSDLRTGLATCWPSLSFCICLCVCVRVPAAPNRIRTTALTETPHYTHTHVTRQTKSECADQKATGRRR